MNSDSHFFQDSKYFWTPYTNVQSRIQNQTLVYQGILKGQTIDQDGSYNFFQVYQDHIIKYLNYQEFIRNPVKSKQNSQILFTDQLSMELYELSPNININESMKFSLVLNQNDKQYFLCCKNQNELLCWYEKLKQVCIQPHYYENFKTLQKIGEGAFAKVYKVQRKVDNLNFAAKVFNKKKINDNEKAHTLKIALLNEIKIYRTIQNQNMVKLHEVYETQNEIILIMNLYNGGDLYNQILKQKIYSEKMASIFLRQILEQLQYIHSLNIIHRDLKLENIMFKNYKSLNIHIIDFGLSELILNNSKLYKRCGTPGYVAPEILNNQLYGTKVDLFSAGVILYILLTGCQPFFANNKTELILKNQKAQVNYDFEEINLQLSKKAVDFLQKLLQRNPRERISAKEALNHPWILKYQYCEMEFDNMIIQNQNIQNNENDEQNLQQQNQQFQIIQIQKQRQQERNELYQQKQKLYTSTQNNKFINKNNFASILVQKQYQNIQLSSLYQKNKKQISQIIQSKNGNIDSIDTNDESPRKPQISGQKKIQQFDFKEK